MSDFATRCRFEVVKAGRGFVDGFLLPAIRPLLWRALFFDMARRPVLLRYLKVRMELLDRFEELFPGARECSSRDEIYDLGITAAKSSGLKGLWLEFGVWNGSSINYIARKTADTVFGFDSFEGLPSDWSQGGTRDSLVKADHFKVQRLPSVRGNVQLVKGWFDATLPPFLAQHPEPVAFMHIDSDVYESAKTVLDCLGDRLVKGSIIVFDELYNYPKWEEHEYKALQEFLAKSGKKISYLGYNSSGEQVVVQLA